MASDGDTILVQTGVYLEIVQTDKALSILANDGAGTVSINALNFGPALSFSNVDGPVTIEGLVLENGGGTRGFGEAGATCRCSPAGATATTTGPASSTASGRSCLR